MNRHQGKFRHVFGQPLKPDQRFLEVKNPQTSGEGRYVAANAKFFAVARGGGGGPVYVKRHDKPGRFPANIPMLSVHKGTTWDMDFHPFIDNMIATASNDLRLAVTTFPVDGLTETIHDPTVVLEGHGKKVTLCQFNPCAASILASGSFDRTVRVWNIETAAEVGCFSGFDENVFSMEWSRDGSQLLCSSKDKRMRVFDPRQIDAVQTFEAFDGTKSSKAFWVSRHGWVGATGFSKQAKRQIRLWDLRALEKPLLSVGVDSAAGVFMPNFDDDNGVLYLAAKGEGNVVFYEIVNDDRILYTLGVHRQTTPQKGGGWVPKKGLDVWKCEVQRFLKLTANSVIPISFIVPRKAGADVFQADIFPDCHAGIPALDAAAWESGENKPPVLMSMDPAKRGDESGVEVSFQKKATYAELLEENKQLRAENEHLKAQLKEIKQRYGEEEEKMDVDT